MGEVSTAQRGQFTGRQKHFPVEFFIGALESVFTDPAELRKNALHRISSDLNCPAGLWKSQSANLQSWKYLKSSLLKALGRNGKPYSLEDKLEFMLSLQKRSSESRTAFLFRVRWVVASVIGSSEEKIWAKLLFLLGLSETERASVISEAVDEIKEEDDLMSLIIENNLPSNIGLASQNESVEDQNETLRPVEAEQKIGEKSTAENPATVTKSFEQDKSHSTVNNPSKESKCHICGKTFKGNANYRLQMHMRIHTGDKPYQCKYCSKWFRMSHFLTRHMRVHTASDKPYQCKICSKCFAQESALNNHLQIHTGETPFQCSVCFSGYWNKTSLNQHMKSHSTQHIAEDQPPTATAKEVVLDDVHQASSMTTRDNLEDDVQYLGTAEAEQTMAPKSTPKNTASLSEQSNQEQGKSLGNTSGKNERCDVCGKTFSSKRKLQIHMPTHTGEKPHECKYCSKSFTQRNYLIKHVRVHTGEKPHKCKYCSKSFTQRHHLIIHMRVHTGEKPYQCHICSRKFSQKVSLTRHMKSHESQNRAENTPVTASTDRNVEVLFEQEMTFQCILCSKNFSNETDLEKHMENHT